MFKSNSVINFPNDISIIINYFFICLAFVLPLSRAGISFFSFLLVIAILFDRSIKVRFQNMISNNIIKAVLIFIGFNFLSLFWVESKNIYDALDYILKYCYFFSIFVALVYVKKEYIYKIISAFIFGLFISELISYSIFFELITYNNVSPLNPTPFMSHLDYSIFLAFGSLLLLSRFIYEKERKYKILYGFFFLSITINLFIIGGRTGQLAFFITLLVLFFGIFENKLKAMVLSLSVGIIIFSSAYAMSELFHSRVHLAVKDIQKVIDSNDYDSSWGKRVGAIIIATEITKENPIFGIGISDNMEFLRNSISNNSPELMHMIGYAHFHNQYLQILTQTGFIGLIIFLNIFYQIYKLKFNNNEFNVIKIILPTIFLVGFIGEPFLHKQFTMVLFAVFVGLLVAKNRIENENITSK